MAFLFLINLAIYIFVFNVICCMFVLKIIIWSNKRSCIVFILQLANHILWKLLTIGLLVCLAVKPYNISELYWTIALLVLIKGFHVILLKIALGSELNGKVDIWKLKL